jgi:DNA-directed RNA polymerase subunit RPC12/RpoP
MNDDGIYKCIFCGKKIAVRIDLPPGTTQDYVDDCPKCTRSNGIHVAIKDNGDVRVSITSPLSKNNPESFDVLQEASGESITASDSPAY